MNVAAISAIPRVAAPYPARIPMLEETRPAWETEWAARSGAARRAGRGTPAAWEAQRLARAGQVPPAPLAGVAAALVRDHADAVPARSAIPPALDTLRDQYADTRMRRAIADYAAQSAAPAQGANANDLGTIEGLMPLQPYRVAMGNPQVHEWQAAATVKAGGAGIPKVANIGATENATDNARYRPGFAP
ncbi:hypothetical protein [Achromobacter agilis]|uniref:Uncharacterized protein n=1 Tax=Achromobacter agilis TaxID=1353888 RepID=A0A446CX46_9BURK|nr:hypothetical protein [Achromobacter agilis]SSW72420.1 hypothetical protein AGI3411_05581 [Achromobacter agilis]